MEIITIVAISLTVPIAVLDILMRAQRQPPNARLQKFSQSGRKACTWSKEINVQQVQRIAAITGASHAEILLAALSDALKEYCQHIGEELPAELLCTAKLTSQKTLYGNERQRRGLLFFALPVKVKTFDNEKIELLQNIQRNIRDARRNQRAIYAITKATKAAGTLISAIPSIIIKIILNHLTSRYSISITHVDGYLSVTDVKSAVFWKPPQGNCSLSITLHRHGDILRLAVMADATIGPQLSVITKNFPKSLGRIETSFCALNSSGRSPSPCPDAPANAPGH